MDSVMITSMYASMLGIILLLLSVRIVAVVRGKGEVNLGDGGNPEFTTIVRAQANFIEYVPMIVILIAFAESGGTSSLWIHGLGSALVLGRILHPFGMSSEPGIRIPRFVGTILTWAVLLISSIIVLIQSLG